MIKGVAQYWLSMLVPDEHFKDGSLVAVPCNSPEHGPTVRQVPGHLNQLALC
jgi:alpha-L-fucosidase 2